MKYLSTTIAASLLAYVINAKSSGYQVIRSLPSGDLAVNILIHEAGDNNYSLTAPIEYEFVTLTNKNCQIDLPKNEFFCTAQMFDSDGNTIPLNTKYADLGKRFYDVKYPSPEQPWSKALGEVLRMKPARITGPSGPSLGIGPQMQADFVIAEKDAGERRSLPSIEELFVVKTPGKYRIKLQFQAYYRISKGEQAFGYKLERFKPIEFAVSKEYKP